MAEPQVVIIMGSGSDEPWAKQIWDELDTLEIKYVTRVASAHRTPAKLLGILAEYEDKKPVIITVAGLSDALSGAADANTANPVIACPPKSDSPAYIVSTRCTPPGVAPMLCPDQKGAAESAAKILSLTNSSIYHKLMLKYKVEPMERELGHEVVLVTNETGSYERSDETKKAKGSLDEFRLEYSEVEFKNFDMNKYTNRSIFLLLNYFESATYHPVIKCSKYTCIISPYDHLCVDRPDNLVLALAKVVGRYDDGVRQKVLGFQQKGRSKVEEADFKFSKLG